MSFDQRGAAVLGSLGDKAIAGKEIDECRERQSQGGGINFAETDGRMG